MYTGYCGVLFTRSYDYSFKFSRLKSTIMQIFIMFWQNTSALNFILKVGFVVTYKQTAWKIYIKAPDFLRSIHMFLLNYRLNL